MEPRSTPSRPIPMKHTLMLSLAVALAASGCGQEQRRESPPQEGPSHLAGCRTDRSASAMESAQPVPAAVDLDHDGEDDPVKVTRDDSRCPGVIFTTVKGDLRSSELHGTLDLETAQRVVVPGLGGDLLAVREAHPRGGYQVHVYGYADGGFGAVHTGGGQSVVPFVATDTRGSYLSVTCRDGALVVREAVAHEPPGIVFAWDIRETPYAVDGLVATRGATTEIADNVLDDRLGSTYPDVKKRQMFAKGCSA